MKLVYYNLNLVLDIKEGAVNSIVLESPEWLERFIMDLQDSIENGAEEVALYNSQDDPLDLHRKCELIISPFDLTFDKKEIQRKLFQELQSTILDENFIEDFSRIQSEIIQLLDRMGEASDYGLDFEAELDLPALFRMYHLHIQDPQGHFDEKRNAKHHSQGWKYHGVDHILDLAGGVCPGLLHGVRHVAGGGGCEGRDHAQGGHHQGQEQDPDALFSDAHS